MFQTSANGSFRPGSLTSLPALICMLLYAFFAVFAPCLVRLNRSIFFNFLTVWVQDWRRSIDSLPSIIPHFIIFYASFSCPKLCPLKQTQTYTDSVTVDYLHHFAFYFFYIPGFAMLKQDAFVMCKHYIIKGFKCFPVSFCITIVHSASGGTLF